MESKGLRPDTVLSKSQSFVAIGPPIPLKDSDGYFRIIENKDQ